MSSNDLVLYLFSKINGEDGGRLGGPVGAVMVVVVVCPLFVSPSEQILVAQRNTAIVLQELSGRRERAEITLVQLKFQQICLFDEVSQLKCRTDA